MSRDPVPSSHALVATSATLPAALDERIVLLARRRVRIATGAYATAWLAGTVVSATAFGIAAATVALLASLATLPAIVYASERCVAHVGNSVVTLERTIFGVTREVSVVERHEIRRVLYEPMNKRVLVGWKPVPCDDPAAAARIASIIGVPFATSPAAR